MNKHIHPLMQVLYTFYNLEETHTDVPGWIIDGMVDFLDEYKCCAFCKECGKHDQCPCSDDGMFQRLEWCDYYKDRREDDKYHMPNGLVTDFYMDFVNERDK